MDRMRALPLPALLPLIFALLFAAWFALGMLVEADDFAPLQRAVGAFFYASIATVCFGFAIRNRRRRLGGAQASVVVQRAVRTGALPEHERVDASVWRPELELLRRRYRSTLAIVPVMAVLGAGFSIWAAFTITPLWWGFLVVFVVLCAWGYRDARRSVRSIDGLLPALELHPALPGSSGVAPVRDPA